MWMVVDDVKKEGGRIESPKDIAPSIPTLSIYKSLTFYLILNQSINLRTTIMISSCVTSPPRERER